MVLISRECKIWLHEKCMHWMQCLCFRSNCVTLVSLVSSDRSRSGALSSGRLRIWHLRSSVVRVTIALWTCGPWVWFYTSVWVEHSLSTRTRTLISRSPTLRSCIHASRGPSSHWRVRDHVYICVCVRMYVLCIYIYIYTQSWGWVTCNLDNVIRFHKIKYL